MPSRLSLAGNLSPITKSESSTRWAVSSGSGREGRLEFRGPSATSGYFENAAKTRELFHDGWLDTGDRAYMAGGDLFVTGRIKDIIIRAGQHIAPHEIEEAVGAIPGFARTGSRPLALPIRPRDGTRRNPGRGRRKQSPSQKRP